MPRNGSGIYGPPAGTAAVPNTTIESADYNAVVADISQALTDSINVSGTAPFQANQPMGSNKLTNLGAGSIATDSVNLAQSQSGIAAHAATVGGTPDAITLTFAPAFTAYAAKMRFRFTAGGANTITNPTVNVDGLGAKVIKKLNAVALDIADIAGAGHVCDCLYDGTDVLLLNFAPMTPAEPNTFTEKQTFNKPITTPMTTLADAATIAWDMNVASSDVRIVLSSSRILGLPTNVNKGQSGIILIQQDGTGGWGLTSNSIFEQSGGQTALDLDTAPNSKTLYCYEVVEKDAGAKAILIGRMWSEGKTSIGFYKEYMPGTYVSSHTRTVTHGLGRLPSLVQVWVKFTTAEFGFTTNDYIDITSLCESDTADRKPAVFINSTTVRVRIGSSNNGIFQRLDAFNITGIASLSTPPEIIVRVFE